MNETEKPSYEIAREKLHAMLAALIARGITISISEPFPEVREKGKWPCIVYNVSFNGKVFPWYMGIGHVKMPKAFFHNERSKRSWELRTCGMTDDDAMFFERGKLNHRDQKENARMAVVLAKYQKLVPDASEVLARVCADALSADVVYEEWATEYGYDIDSISAKGIYDDCTRYGKIVRGFLTRAEFVAFAELANEL